MRGKRALSQILSYVLLVALALTLAAIVYAWLSSYAKTALEEEKCPDGVNIRFEVKCEGNNVKLTLINNGFFTVNGFVAKYSEKQGKATTKPLNDAGGSNEIEKTIEPQSQEEFSLTKTSPAYVIEVLPYIYQKEGDVEKKLYCGDAVVKKDVECW